MHDLKLDAAPKDNLSTLVKEAFIDPIRSVLIIDDKYPTWEQIFSTEGYDTKEEKWADRNVILEVVKQFRATSPALNVDIHDGSGDLDISKFLHQSDLLILDYQLEANEPHGIIATNIIDHLFKSNHFNLIVLHTDEPDINIPLNQILFTLLPPIPIDPHMIDLAKDIIADAEDSGLDNIESRLYDAVSKTTYLEYRRARDGDIETKAFIKKAPAAAQFKAICDEAKWTNEERLSVWLSVINSHQTEMLGSPNEKTGFKWKSFGETDCPWIRTSGGFVAFSQKPKTNLIDTLRNALEDWKPSPSRLISARIRAEISAKGVMAEDATFNDRRAHWRYYQELLANISDTSRDFHRKSLLEAHTARHTERLLDQVSEKVTDFGMRVVKCDPQAKDTNEEGFSSHYDLPSMGQEEKDLSLHHYNAYISTKSVSGWHLQPGHIILLDNEYWVCASPACDLVPGQKVHVGILDSLQSNIKPFMAVQLHPRSKFSHNDVNSNTMIFLNHSLEKGVQSFSIFPTESDSGSPFWRMMLALDNGQFSLKDGIANITLHSITGENGKLEIVPKQAQIVSQLRYEYALNIINKLGVEFTRIGLDFVAPPKLKKDPQKMKPLGTCNAAEA